jgi:deoxyribodipyrimidine photo-lyase
MRQFPTQILEIEELIDKIDPLKYARTRNFIDGKVTYLSPYLSRGVITLPQVLAKIWEKGYTWADAEKLIQELAWREYYQRVWEALGNGIFSDLRQPQHPVAHRQLPLALPLAQTGIQTIDSQIENLYRTGYMHNHARMYVSAIACNIAQAYWQAPAAWMYYHLLDGDLASNTCSWQWVAGANSNKKYVANQENINHYLHSKERGTFLDRTYDLLLGQPIPEQWKATAPLNLHTPLPNPAPLQLDPAKPLLLYNSYHLDPRWRAEQDANRVLVLEPSHFEKYPVSEKVMQFILDLSQNIPGIQCYVGEVADLPSLSNFSKVYTLTHPTALHYPGQKDERTWMFPKVKGYFPSFFGYWKKCEKLYATVGG